MDLEKRDANSILKNEGGDALYEESESLEEAALKEMEEKEAAAEKAAIEKLEEEKKTAAAEKVVADKKKLAELLYKKPTDLNNAKILKIFSDGKIRFNRDTKLWGFFEGGVWDFASKENESLFPLAKKAAEYTIDKLSKDDSEKVKNCAKVAEKWESTRTWNNAISALKGFEEILIRQADIDKNPMLLNCKNGVLDLETKKLYPAAPELLLTKQANFIYDPRAESEIFSKFIRQVLPDEMTRRADLRYLGYCLTGLINEHKILFAIGKGGNGKGTLFETINHLFGSYSTTFDVELLLKQKFPKNANEASPALSALENCRFAYTPEIPLGRQLNLVEVKRLTGGDTITARAIYQKQHTFEPTFKLVLQGNDLPKIDNVRDKGLLRRLIVIEFTQEFIENPNLHLREELQAAESLSGIANILIGECFDYQKPKAQGGGLILSEAMQESREKYLAENDFIRNFIDDNCEFESNSFITRKAFLERLKKEYPQAYKFGDHKLTEMISEIEGVEYSRAKRGYAFRGIRFNDSAEQGNLGEDFCAPPNFEGED